MNANSTKRICLWSGPRNISTALMYSFGNREDTGIVDEPLYGFYLSQTNAKEYHPGAKAIMESMECDGNKVIAQLLSFDEKPIFFIKNMTHHLLDLELDFLDDMHHLILTRHPEAMIRSFSKVIPNPSAKDLGYEDHVTLISTLKERQLPFHVVDSAEILKDPEKRLNRLCQSIGIPFSTAMLNWPKGPRKEDGVWAKHWYNNVHNSTGFQKPSTEHPQDAMREDLLPLMEESMTHYHQILDA